ncbi:MAG TPA: gamma-glutamyltransferase family protein [Vicinamibacterales bacterium]|nr:gamma-glutamyltransferase family protein [Vicinamibacterales bacterium]
MRSIISLLAAGVTVIAAEALVVSAAQRPLVSGRTAGVSAGHPLTTAAAVEILQQGGNAFDAGVAAMLVGGVVEQDLYGFGGEGLVLVYPRKDKTVTSIVGQGWAAKAATIDWYTSRNKTLAGEGLDPVVVPGAPHAALTVLERWGTMPFARVAARAIAYARDGFPLRPRTAATIDRQREFISRWPTNQKTWLKADGSPYKAGDTIALPELGRTLQKMADAEKRAGSRGRIAGLRAARDRFYKGDIAQEMVRFLKANGSPFEASDFAEYYARVEAPASVTYRDVTVYKHGFGSQGPALLQTLNILENFDLKSMGHNSADYLHVITEAMKMAYADRDSYYGDPAFVKAPAKGLLSKEYAKVRARQIDMAHAAPQQAAGDPLPFDPDVKSWPYWIAGKGPAGTPPQAGDDDPSLKDTTHISVVDKAGNVFDATPSGGWISGGVVAGSTGVALSTRGEQFWLDKTRSAQLRPRSRPRYTLTPSLVLRNGEPFLALGTPGGDNQEQTILQAFLNIIEFPDKWYPNLHTAFELPRIQTFHFLSSFWPHRIDANRLDLEGGIPADVLAALKARGHDVRMVPAVSISGCATAVMIDPRTGNRIAGADPRRDCYAWAY